MCTCVHVLTVKVYNKLEAIPTVICEAGLTGKAIFIKEAYTPPCCLSCWKERQVLCTLHSESRSHAGYVVTAAFLFFAAWLPRQLSISP